MHACTARGDYDAVTYHLHLHQLRGNALSHGYLVDVVDAAERAAVCLVHGAGEVVSGNDGGIGRLVGALSLRQSHREYARGIARQLHGDKREVGTELRTVPASYSE